MTALEILGLGTYDNCIPTITGKTETAVTEMKTVYQERLPYTTVILLEGLEYVWSETFIDNCIEAMSTDSLAGLTTAERKIWYAYVDWCNHNTHSADLELYPTAIGCTIPDEITGLSYVVLEGDITTINLCNAPLWDILKPDLYKSLDNVFINKLNCLPYNTYAVQTVEVVSVSGCTI